MTITRQDAWTQDEDLLLAEVVLRHIREGGTQLSAFEEVGRKLTRTAAACGFRWNSYVRKQYQSGIEAAKKQRKELRKKLGVHASHFSNELTSYQPEKTDGLSLQDVIRFLEQYQQAPSNSDLLAEKNQLAEQVEELKKETAELKEENSDLKSRLQAKENDYKALIEIMDRAREIVSWQERK